ncbi:uncharacterized protein LOC115224527 [Argonauta hians]
MSSKKFQFTSMKKKSNNNNGKAANQKFQPTLFQTWGSKNTVSNSSTTTTDTRTTNVPSTSNYSGDINNHDITIVSENDVDLLLQALEDDERLSATTGTVQSNDGEGTGVAAIESNWDIDLDNIPDLPGFDKFAGRLWIYPTNYPVREYQYNIVKEALFTNTLVVLPTGLGKTFIAAVVMFNFYRWYPSGIVLFLAPTKPLVAQQIEACYNIMGIPQSDMAEMTGKQMPASRRQMWDEKRILFLTPQVLINDLTRGTCVAARIKCIVLDEAHKSLGNYAYCQVIREVAKQNPDFRVLALSATPGNTLKSVQEVLTNLMITAVAIRTEECPDVKKYSNERRIETIVVPLGPVIEDIQKKYVEILESIVNRLATRRLLFNMKVQTITKFSVLKARNAFRQKPPQNLSPSAMGCIEGDFGLLITLCHGHELLQLHGLRSFYQYISNMGDSTSSRSKRELFKNPMFVQIYEKLRTDYEQNISFTQMSSQQRSVPYAVGHPKLEKLLEIVVNHFKSFQKENGHLETRVMIFSQYRNSVTDIAEMLKRERPLVRAMTFIGQSSGKNTKGFTQKEQIKVMKDFRDGGFNTLIATCVGEEGLDIGEVDLIVCFDTCKSPVRLVQRMGRTGRKREGRIIMLVTKGKEEQMYKQAKYQWNSISRSLKEGYSKLALSSHQPKLIPEEKKKTTAPPLTQNILQFTSPEVSLLDYLPQPSTSKSGKEDSTERAMKERRFSRLSSDEESELLNLGLKERLLSKKAGKDTGKSGGKKNKKKKTGTKDQGDMEKRAKETTTKGARNELRCSDEEMEFEPLTREDTVCLSDKDIGLKPFLREDTNNGKVASSSRNADDHESCKDFPEPSLVEFSDSDIFPDLKLQPEMSKEGSDSLNQISHDDDGGGGDGRLSPVVSLKSVKSDKGSSGLAQSTVDVLIQDLIRPDVLKRTAEPSLLSVTRTQSSPNLFDDDDYFLSDESFVMNNDLDPVSQVKLTDDTKVEPEMKPEMSNKNTSVSKADYSSLTSPISGLCCSSVDTPSPVGQTETKIKTDGIYFDLSTDLFSDDCDFTAGCSAGNIPLLSSKLSSLINCHTTIKDSSTNSSCKHLEDSINFDLEFDSVFRPSDGAGQRSNSGFIDDPVGFDLQFDSDEDGWKIPEEKDEPGTSSANSSNSGLASRLKKGWLTTKRSTPKPAVVSRNKRRKIGKINDNEGYQFLDVEAEVTGSEEEADDEEEEAVDDTENHYGGSFIDEDYTSGNTQVDMTAVYLKSVISPVCKPRGYKLQYSHHVSEVYSQLSESDIDCYEPDSFLDDSEIPMSDSVSANATQEIVLQAQRPKPKGPVKRRVIRCISSSSEEEEEKGKETNMEPPQTEVQKKISHHQHQQPLSKDHTRSSVSHDISAGKSTSSSQQHPLPAPQGVILADSRTISGAQEILSNLKSKYDIPVEVVKLKAADYAVSDRTGVVRMYQSDAYSVTNNHKMTNRLQQLTSLYDRPCFIIEKDPFKKGLASTKTPLHQTKYYEKLLSYIGRSPTRLLFSGNKDETCTLLAELFLQEKMKGFAIEDLRLNNKQEQKLKFLLTFPDLNYALALNICKNFTSMGELLSSCVAEIACKGNMSEDRADFIYQYIHKEPSNKP